MHTMTEIPAIKHHHVRRHATRVMWACGLLFTLLLLMGLTGVASITLMHEDEQYFKAMQGVEGTVARAVLDLKWLIHATHQFGGYAAVLFAFWAGGEIFRFGRKLRHADNAGWRVRGRYLPFLGAAGSLIVIAALAALSVSGYMTAEYLADRPTTIEELEIPSPLEAEEHERDIRPEARPVVDWHTRELNYAMALGAILLVLGASSVRNVALEAKRAGSEDQDSGSSQK